MHFAYPPCMLHGPPISSSLPLLFEQYFLQEYTLWSSSLCSFLQSLIISYLLGANILHSILFSDILSRFSFTKIPLYILSCSEELRSLGIKLCSFPESMFQRHVRFRRCDLHFARLACPSFRWSEEDGQYLWTSTTLKHEAHLITQNSEFSPYLKENTSPWQRSTG
jgi:hypothetical protein